MQDHNEAVKLVASQVRSFYDRKAAFRIYHGSTNSTRPQRFQRDKIVDTSHLDHVLRIDRFKRTALCEPNVSMRQLVRETMKSGMVPQVVMEFPGITVGGGFAGTSGESSSFKHGFFENTVNSIEIILASGEVVKATRTERADLLEAAAGSLGTFGVTTLLEVQLIHASPYVQLDFFPVHTVSAAIQELEKATLNPTENDYVDGIVFGKDLCVIMTGHLIDKLPLTPEIPVERFTRATDQWFYRYVEERLIENEDQPFSIAVPLVDYLFRYDRGAFWGGHLALKYFMVPFNHITRYVLDPLLNAKVMYHGFHESGLTNKYIVQDIGFPKSTTESFLKYLDHDYGFYPLWLCPLKKGLQNMPLRPHTGSQISDKALSEEMIINVGVWGPGPKKVSHFVEANRQMEKKTRELYGVKALYAHTYYTEEEFWQIYDKSWYDQMRNKYGANTLPSVFEKTKVDVAPVEMGLSVWDIWPVAGVYGAVKAGIAVYSPFGSDYVLERPGGVLRWSQVPLLVVFAFVLRFISRWV